MAGPDDGPARAAEATVARAGRSRRSTAVVAAAGLPASRRVALLLLTAATAFAAGLAVHARWGDESKPGRPVVVAAYPEDPAAAYVANPCPNVGGADWSVAFDVYADILLANPGPREVRLIGIALDDGIVLPAGTSRRVTEAVAAPPGREPTYRDVAYPKPVPPGAILLALDVRFAVPGTEEEMRRLAEVGPPRAEITWTFAFDDGRTVAWTQPRRMAGNDVGDEPGGSNCVP